MNLVLSRVFLKMFPRLSLNLKQVRFKVTDPEPKTVRIDASGEGLVTAGDIISGDGRCEVLNKKQPHCHAFGKSKSENGNES